MKLPADLERKCLELAQPLYVCPQCLGQAKPKDCWPINPRQGYIQCPKCGRIPEKELAQPKQADFTVERREPLELRLPWPPTTNHYRAIFTWIKHGKAHARLITSAAGRNYLDAVQDQLGKQRPFAGRLSVAVVAHAPTAVKIDLDNRLKPLLDALKKANVIEDDSQIDDLRIVRGPLARPDGFVEVAVRQL